MRKSKSLLKSCELSKKVPKRTKEEERDIVLMISSNTKKFSEEFFEKLAKSKERAAQVKFLG